MSEKVAFNMNRMVYVRLTEKGREYLREEYARFWQEQKEAGAVPAHYAPPAYIERSVDSEGFSAFQLWQFMDKFGPIMGLTFDALEYFKDGTDMFFEARGLKPQLQGSAPKAVRPDHYGPKGLQVLDALKAWMTPEEYRGFLCGNVIKYLGRLGKKDASLQEAKKAREYLDLLITELEQAQ